jgi:mxaA protein
MKYLIKQSTLRFTLPNLLVISSLLVPIQGFANEAAVKVRSLINPIHSNAIQIGDVLKRK